MKTTTILSVTAIASTMVLSGVQARNRNQAIPAGATVYVVSGIAIASFVQAAFDAEHVPLTLVPAREQAAYVLTIRVGPACVSPGCDPPAR